MAFSRKKIIHHEVIDLKITPAQVREFIMTPERILDYYPAAIEGGVIEPGASIYCRGKSGVSLLEIIAGESDEQLLVVKVTTAANLSPPFTAERIKAAKFFTMLEDWQIAPLAEGTRLTKTWRDITKYKYKFLPMGMIVRASAKKESATLKAAWNSFAAG